MPRAKYARRTTPVRLLRAIHLPVGPDVRGILLIALAFMVIWFTASKVSRFVLPYRLRTVEARFGVIEEAWTGRALAVRQESVVHSPASGELTMLVGEGDRVRAGDVICEVNSAGEIGALPVAREQIDQLLKEADDQIRKARNTGAKKRNELNAQLAETSAKVQELEAAGRIEEARKAEGEQRSLEARLREVAAAEAEAVLQAELRRQELLRRRETLLGGAPSSSVYLVRATQAGVVSFQFDGLESTMTLDAPLHDIAAVKREGATVKRANKEIVTAGAPLFRLVKDTGFYLYVAVEGAGALRQGEYVNVKMRELGGNAEKELRMRVARAEERPGKALALLASAEFNAGLLNLRHLQVRISRAKHEGIVVPLSSLVSDAKGNPGVYVMLEQQPVFMRAKPGARDQTNVIIDGVPLGARVVTNPWLLMKQNR